MYFSNKNKGRLTDRVSLESTPLQSFFKFSSLFQNLSITQQWLDSVKRMRRQANGDQDIHNWDTGWGGSSVRVEVYTWQTPE